MRQAVVLAETACDRRLSTSVSTPAAAPCFIPHTSPALRPMHTQWASGAATATSFAADSPDLTPSRSRGSLRNL
jgi:hypothetical protein